MSKPITTPGQLRDQCNFLSPLEGRDASGAPISTWIASQQVFCKLEYKIAGSDEGIIGARYHAETRVLVTIRHIDAINEKMRLYFHDYEWNIKTIQRHPMRDYTILEVLQDRPSTLIAWKEQDNGSWLDPDGNEWLLANPSATLADATGISWTDNEGFVWSPSETIN